MKRFKTFRNDLKCLLKRYESFMKHFIVTINHNKKSRPPITKGCYIMMYSMKELADLAHTNKQNVYRYLKNKNVEPVEIKGNKQLFSEQTAADVCIYFADAATPGAETVEPGAKCETIQNDSSELKTIQQLNETIQELNLELVKARAEVDKQAVLIEQLTARIEELKEDKEQLRTYNQELNNNYKMSLHSIALIEANHKPSLFERIFKRKNKADEM